MKIPVATKIIVACLCTAILPALAGNTVSAQDKTRYLNQVFEKIAVSRDIEFGEVTNHTGQKEKLLLDVYAPVDDNETNRPAILWIHGGGFRPGNDKKQSYIVRLSEDFARRGYVCVSVNYRIRTNPQEDKPGTMRDALSDAMEGLNWIRTNKKNLGIDPARIILGGGSAGGMLAVNFGLKENSREGWNLEGVLGVINLWGSPDSSYLFSPVRKDIPPMLIIHGTADKTVPYRNAVRLAARLDSAGVRHELLPLENAEHTPMNHYPVFVEKIAAFIWSLPGIRR